MAKGKNKRCHQVITQMINYKSELSSFKNYFKRMAVYAVVVGVALFIGVFNLVCVLLGLFEVGFFIYVINDYFKEGWWFICYITAFAAVLLAVILLGCYLFGDWFGYLVLFILTYIF